MAQSPANISPYQVGLGALVIVINAILSVSMKLDLEWQLTIGALR